MSDITLDIQDQIATITLNRPEARNALSMEMREGLAEFTGKLELDDNVRCVVLKGAGGHFMGGGDIKTFKARAEMSPTQKKEEILKGIHLLHYAIYRMRRMPKPMICGVQGAAAGAGVSLVAACDLAIASESSFFTLAYANIGVSPDASSTYFLTRTMGMKRVFEMMFLADRYTGEEAREMGLVNRVVPDDKLDNELNQLATRLANGPTYAYGRGKALMNSSLHKNLEAQLEDEGYAIADCMNTADHVEGITAFIEKRKPTFKGK